MQYLLLIYQDEKISASASESERNAVYKAYMEFTADIKKSGHMLGGNALKGVATATTVRVRDGKTLNTDGPFAETKEQLGGFYMIEAADLDEATKIAARIPTAANGSIEVRPVSDVG